MVVLGIDQGGTKTAAAVCDLDGNILGTGRSGGACHQTGGMERAMRRVLEAAGQALTNAGLSLGDVAAGGGGLTGVDWPHETELLRSALVSATGVRAFTVKNDVFGAFRAGSSGASGVCVCSGSATNVCAVSPDGAEYAFNFYCTVGHPGKMGINAVLEAYCGLAGATSLTEAALNFFEVRGVDGLLRKRLSGEITNTRAKAFAPHVFAAASAGDAAARGVAAGFAEACARYALAAMKRFQMLASPVELVLSGGIFKTGCSLVTEHLAEYVRRQAPLARVVNAAYEPVVGALLYALEAAGRPADAQARANLARTAEAWGLTRLKPNGAKGATKT